MQYRTLLALLSAPFLALAQSTENPFNIPPEGIAATAGEPLTITWEPTTPGTISLILRSGASNDLDEGTPIAENIDNSGSFTWTPSDDLTRGSDYAIEIVDDENPDNSNYTPQFVLDTSNTVAQPSGSASSVATAATSSGLPTVSATSVAAVSSALASSAGSVLASASASASGAASSASDAVSSASEAANSAAASASDAATAAQTENAGSRKSAMVGVMGVVALGAWAL